MTLDTPCATPGALSPERVVIIKKRERLEGVDSLDLRIIVRSLTKREYMTCPEILAKEPSTKNYGFRMDDNGYGSVTIVSLVGNYTTAIAEKKDYYLRDVVASINDTLVLHYFHDTCSIMVLYDIVSGTGADIELEKGAVGSIVTSISSPELYFSWSGPIVPGGIFTYNVPKKKLTLSQPRNVGLGITLSEYASKQVWTTSSDGTSIPVHLVYHKSISTHFGQKGVPTILYGYGGFGVAVQPSFSARNIASAKLVGGIYAIAHIRGGSEFGKQWHDAATGLGKQKSINDFVGAARGLVDLGFARKGMSLTICIKYI